MSNWIKDLRWAFRMLRKDFGFTLIVVLTLALGIGANTTVFSWINATLLNPIPGATNTQGLVAFVRGERTDNSFPSTSYPDYRDLRRQNSSFIDMMGYHHDWVTLTGAGQPERLYGTLITSNYFQVLGIKPLMGRFFRPEDENNIGGAPWIILSHSLWQTRFQGDRSVLGKTLEINRHPYTVIGVAPPLFEGTATGLRTAVWIPISMDQKVWGFEQLRLRQNNWLNVLGLLKPGVGRTQAQEDINHRMQQIALAYPDEHRDTIRMNLAPLWRAPLGANGMLYRALLIMAAMAFLVLLLSCANAANLMLVRSIGRRHEFAVRLSVGCNRKQLLRQLLMESLAFALLGGVAALSVGHWTAGLLAYFIPSTDLPVFLQLNADAHVAWVTLLFSILAGGLWGVLPALRSLRLSPAEVLKDEGQNVSGDSHRSRLTGALVVVQISLSMLLLVSAGLFYRSLCNMQQQNLGFNAENVLLVSFDLFPAGYSNEEGYQFLRALPSKLEAIRRIHTVSMADSIPLSFSGHSSAIEPEGYQPRKHESMEVGMSAVGPAFLQTLQIPLLAGRDFSIRDERESPAVVIINRILAERYWPGQDPLGKRIMLLGRNWSIIGVTDSFRWDLSGESHQPFLFVPILQSPRAAVTLYLRVYGNPHACLPAVKNAFAGMNPNLALFDVTALSQRLQTVSFSGKLACATMAVFGLLSLFLASIGVYGVIANAVGQRTHEIGIRVAIGAGKGRIVGMVMKQGLMLTVFGLILGGILSAGLTGFLRSQLIGVSPMDATTYLAASVVLCLTMILAVVIPARRAVQVSPIRSLRCH